MCEKYLSALQTRLASIHSRLVIATKAVGRDQNDITILAAIKGRTNAEVQAALAAGIQNFGENYTSDVANRTVLPLSKAPVWHFIGPIQANKTKIIATHFDWVQSVDRLKTARRLDAQRPDGRLPLAVCVQVNLDYEPQKAGVLPEQALEFCVQVAKLKNLHLRGLMAIPKAYSESTKQRVSFAELFKLFTEIQQKTSNESFDTLSMGMSGDFEVAIQCGATMIRLGTSLFGRSSVQH